MIFNYCPVCGTKSEQRMIGDEGMVAYCAQCQKPLFPVSYSCILTLIIDEYDNFAFIQQNSIPSHLYIGVAGYSKCGETFEETVRREVQEEVGLVVNDVQFIKSYCYTDKDLIMVGFVSYVNHSDFILSQEVDSAKWFSQEEATKVLPENSTISFLFCDYINKNQMSKTLINQ